MGADQLAEIRPALREAIDGGPDTCVTFEVSGCTDKWVQFVGDSVNAAYPLRQAPDVGALASAISAPLTPKLIAWEAEKFATFQCDQWTLRDLARWIDHYFIYVLKCEADGYHLDIRFEKL